MAKLKIIWICLTFICMLLLHHTVLQSNPEMETDKEVLEIFLSDWLEFQTKAIWDWPAVDSKARKTKGSWGWCRELRGTTEFRQWAEALSICSVQIMSILTESESTNIWTNDKRIRNKKRFKGIFFFLEMPRSWEKLMITGIGSFAPLFRFSGLILKNSSSLQTSCDLAGALASS